MTDKATRAPRITPERQREILRFDLRGVPEVEIARRLNVHRSTVRRALERTRAVLAVSESLQVERARALAVLLEVQRTAWQAVEDATDHGRNPAALLREIRHAQTAINDLLGLATIESEEPEREDTVEAMRAAVVAVIQTHAPELAPRLIEALREEAEATRTPEKPAWIDSE